MARLFTTVGRELPIALAIVGALRAGLVAVASAHSCALPGNAVTIQSSKLDLNGAAFTVATQRLADINNATSRLLVLDARCRMAWTETVDGDLSHFDVRTLGEARLLHFVTMRVAGDGTVYIHRLLAMRAGRLTPMLPPVQHTGKDGFYLGTLNASGNEGIVTWTADLLSDGEGEAGPHSFIVRTWLWSGGRLLGPRQHETARQFVAPDTAPSRADFVAKAMGLPFRDQTGDVRSRFRDYDHVEDRLQVALEAQADRR